jgi:hypothetical protein
MAKFRVAAVGDSIMWGQGLRLNQKFCHRVATTLARRVDREFKVPFITARSGATLNAGVSDEDRRARRAGFINWYPHLFSNEAERQKFLDGNESAAANLFAELPAPYPTVLQQIEQTPDTLGAGIDLLLLNGGANDVDFARVLHPDGHSLPVIDETIKRYLYESMMNVVAVARRKFPNAVIIIPGYYSAFSRDSDSGDVKRFIESETSDTLELLNSIAGVFGQDQDFDELAVEIHHRSEYAQNRALYWLRKAVTDLNNFEGIRGPGFHFAPSTFRPENAVFATGLSLVYEKYNDPDDPMEADRLRFSPRLDEWPKLKEARSLLTGDPAGAIAALNGITGPTHLVDLVKGAVTSRKPLGGHDVAIVRGTIETERKRLTTARIASFLHPNTSGAEAYAASIIKRWEALRSDSLEADLRRLAAVTERPGDPSSLLRRWGLNPDSPADVLRPFMQVDSVAFEVETLDQSGSGQLSLALADGRQRWHLHGGKQKFPRGPVLLPIDTYGDLHLSELANCRLEYDGEAWSPGAVKLHVNGRVVATRTSPSDRVVRLHSGVPLLVPYPAKA